MSLTWTELEEEDGRHTSSATALAGLSVLLYFINANAVVASTIKGVEMSNEPDRVIGISPTWFDKLNAFESTEAREVVLHSLFTPRILPDYIQPADKDARRIDIPLRLRLSRGPRGF
jgi:hypothetical protein